MCDSLLNSKEFLELCDLGTKYNMKLDNCCAGISTAKRCDNISTMTAEDLNIMGKLCEAVHDQFPCCYKLRDGDSDLFGSSHWMKREYLKRIGPYGKSGYKGSKRIL